MQHFQQFISEKREDSFVLDPRSCPGYPWLCYGNSNEVAFGYLPLIGYCSPNVNTLYQAVLARFQQLESEPVLDNIFPFIKQEPHTKAKLDAGRYRLISGVGATDQLVAELLFRPVLQAQMDEPLVHGIAIGWSPNMLGATHFFNCLVDHLSVCADKSAWDWSVNAWMVRFVEELLVFLTMGSNETVVRNHVKAALGPKCFQFRGGFFRTKLFGVLPSGWKLTIFVNSLLQHACHYVCGGQGQLLSMGDDTIQEEEAEGYWESLHELGPTVKEVKRDEREFCGMTFDDNGYYPVYRGKHSFILHHLKSSVAVETLTSYQYLYAYCPEQLHAIQGWIAALGSPERVVPEEILKGIPLGRVV